MKHWVHQTAGIGLVAACVQFHLRPKAVAWMQHLGTRDWDPDFEQIVLPYKPLSKCSRQQHNMDGASIGFDCPPRTHGHHVRGKLAGQPMMGMGSMECLVQMGLCMIRWPNGRSEPFGYNIGCSL